MASSLQFIPGRRSGQVPLLDGFRFCLDKKKNETTYWKCVDFRKGCRARITTLDDQLTSPVPDHSHDPQLAENSVFQAKQSLKRKAAQANQPTKFLCSEAVSGLGYEARAKLGCTVTLDSLGRMARRSKQQYESSQLLLPRSTNIAEGWNHGFHTLLSSSKPSIWKFLDCLKAEQSLTDVKITKRLMCEAPDPRAPKWIRYDQRLQRLVNNYDDFSDPKDYLRAIGCLTMF
ncbi:hypothetical protein ACHWQZ_G015797 [Mnemiopsis leidyi]